MKSLLLAVLVAVPVSAQQLPCPAHPVIMGCANAANLAAMVANPADLVIPQPAPPASAAALQLPIERYRSGKALPLPDEGADDSSGAAAPQ